MNLQDLLLRGILSLVTGEDMEKVEKENMGTVVGIDLGTSYSSVGVFLNGRVEIIANDYGNRITPSYVAFTAEGERLIGEAAMIQLPSNPRNTVFNSKRLIGRAWANPSIQQDIKDLPFKVIQKKKKPHVKMEVGGGQMETFALVEISAMVLSKMKEIAEAYLGKKVTHAVVSVPAYFNDAQRQATKDAGTIAGLEVIRLLNEPSAAGIAYSMKKRGGVKNILVYDLGGGTFDVSLLTVDNGVFEVVATNGDTHLGGEDFNQRVIDHFINLYEDKTGKDIREDNWAIQKLRREVEKAKRALSSQQQALLEIESFFEGKDFSETLSRTKFEQLNRDLFHSTLKPIQLVLDDAKLSKSDIDEIVLVGGSTRIPKIQQLVKDFFNRKELSRGINPDEAVAYGAAVLAAVLSGEESLGNVVLLDVCPFALGVETTGGVMTKLISRNTGLPAMRSQDFTTNSDYQTVVDIKVYEGEDPETKDNNLLGTFDLTGIPLAQSGDPKIKVTFEFTVNGILFVTAKDMKTGNTNAIINDQNQLAPEDIERMVARAERFAEKDRKLQERIDACHHLESYAYILMNQVRDLQKTLDWKIKWLESSGQHAEPEDIRAEKNNLEEAMKSIIRKLYGEVVELPPPCKEQEEKVEL